MQGTTEFLTNQKKPSVILWPNLTFFRPILTSKKVKFYAKLILKHLKLALVKFQELLVIKMANSAPKVQLWAQKNNFIRAMALAIRSLLLGVVLIVRQVFFLQR